MDSPAWVTVTLAMPELSETVTLMPLLAVVVLKPAVRITSEPSIVSFSTPVLATLETRMVIRMMVCPASTVLMLAPLNTATGEPSSVKVGLVAVTLTTGASLTARIFTVTADAVLVVPVSSVTVTETVRAPVFGVVVLLLLYCRLCTSAVTAAASAEALRVITRALPPVPPVTLPMVTPPYSTLLPETEICPAAVPRLSTDSTSSPVTAPPVTDTRMLPPLKLAESASVTTALLPESMSTPLLFSV